MYLYHIKVKEKWKTHKHMKCLKYQYNLDL